MHRIVNLRGGITGPLQIHDIPGLFTYCANENKHFHRDLNIYLIAESNDIMYNYRLSIIISILSIIKKNVRQFFPIYIYFYI